jgi:hypothetical protein
MTGRTCCGNSVRECRFLQSSPNLLRFVRWWDFLQALK